ncbi:MAG: hypothetical protein K5675_00715 [Lachnospiraceae bacterium]|nr:hypothetical protein [Lachnospiraceae bacterium]
MANSEDYLDGLLDSINQAKTENESALNSELRAREERNRRRTRINPEDDFMSMNGLDEFEPKSSSRKNLRHFLSESDYLKEFEEDLDMMDEDEANEYLKEFEEELSKEDAAFAAELSNDSTENFLDSVNEKVSEAKESAVEDLENFSFSALDDEKEDKELEAEELEEEETLDESEEEISLEESSDTSDQDILNNVADILSGDDTDIDLSVEQPNEGEAIDSSSEEEDVSIEESKEIPLAEDEASTSEKNDSLETSDELQVEEIPLDNAEDFLQPEFAEDELDQADASEGLEITEATVQEVPLMDENGDDVDLMDVLDGDSDLMDIGDLLNADENLEELDEAREEFENVAEEMAEKGISLDTIEEEEETSSGGGIFAKILGIFSGIFKKGDSEEDDGTVEIGEDSPTMEELAAEDADILADFKDEQTEVEEDPKEKKKREKEEKKKQKQKEKEQKKKEKEAAKAAAKAAKPPKEKKQKPPKEPDNSPKIPLSRIIPFLLLGISIIAFVLISGNTIYNSRTINEAQTLYEEGNYSACYTKLVGMEASLDEDSLALMQKAKILAKLELNITEYNMAMEQEEYGEALDALVLGTYNYVRNKNEADKLNITEAIDELGGQIETDLANQFGVSEEQAVALVNLSTRKEYTKELHKILKYVNLE